MLTIRDLLTQLTGELQGAVLVKQYNDDLHEFDFVVDLRELASDDPIMDRPTRYMYADLQNYISPYRMHRPEPSFPSLNIEVDGDYE